LLLKSPIIKGDKKLQIFDAVFKGKLDPMMMAFLEILVREGRESYLPEISESFIEQYKRIKHISSVKLTTAVELSEAALAQILQKIKDSGVTDDNIELVTVIDPELIGGFIIEFDR
jgi:F-type H+-transporting ATPase subunit delta